MLLRTFAILLGAATLPLVAQTRPEGSAPIPFDQVNPAFRLDAQEVVTKAHFSFQARTQPRKVRVATMERIFDHPRMGVAMWRGCGFVPEFSAFVHPDGSWSLDDGRGLKATLWPILQRPGHRIYYVEGLVESGRLKNPWDVRARMITSYRYWEEKGRYVSYLQSWTQLDSSLLGFAARPFHGFIKGRQEQFIEYINANIANFGEFAELAPQDFVGPLKQGGDPLALREFEQQFVRK
ncbi:MAG TPA: hypothetical protein VJ505_13215 [Holophagaceae bacterium]|nr:hypothetical protein [Holophagaceae bacterium]